MREDPGCLTGMPIRARVDPGIEHGYTPVMIGGRQVRMLPRGIRALATVMLLVVAGAGSVQSARRIADELRESRFDIHMDVFKRALERELSRFYF